MRCEFFPQTHILLANRRVLMDTTAEKKMMKDEVRQKTGLALSDTEATDTTQSQNGKNGFSSFVEEVKARTEENQIRQKTTPDPLSAPLQMSSTEFTTAMIHFYRGEIQRSNTWRNRLDTTTNWAVLTSGATLSFVFSSQYNPHFVIPINTILVAIFLFMEARRYRYYEVWASRVRVLETGYFAPMLSSSSKPNDKEWADHLAADLISPHFTISEWEAIGRRLRSNYIWIFILLAMSWNLKVYLHPSPAHSFAEFIQRAEVGLVPGSLVFAVGIIFNAMLMFFAVATLRLKNAASEVLPSENIAWHPLRDINNWNVVENLTLRQSKAARRTKKARQRIKQQREAIDVSIPPS